jgi:hypothetical protein
MSHAATDMSTQKERTSALALGRLLGDWLRSCVATARAEQSEPLRLQRAVNLAHDARPIRFLPRKHVCNPTQSELFGCILPGCKWVNLAELTDRDRRSKARPEILIFNRAHVLSVSHASTPQSWRVSPNTVDVPMRPDNQ